jgi:hypothetical protein
VRNFVLLRLQDVSGISGTGPVAEGVEFTNGKVVMQWIVPDKGNGIRPSMAIYDNIESLEAIHGHDGSTIVAWEYVISKLDPTVEMR